MAIYGRGHGPYGQGLASVCKKIPAFLPLVFLFIFAVPVHAQEMDTKSEGYQFAVEQAQAVMGKNFDPSVIRYNPALIESSGGSEGFSDMEFDGGGGMMMSLQADPLIQGYMYDVANSSQRIDVSKPSGAFAYSVPIVLPPGRNGIQPELALSYNHQNGQEPNVAGYGWDIPIPHIDRVNKDGIAGLYSESFFSSSLSGELATTSNASVFLPRVDDGSYLSYTFASSTNQWTVVDKSGTRYLFGHASTSRQDNPGDSTEVYRWMLQEVRDTNDNYVEYEYFKDSGFIYPSRITYTGHGSTDGIFAVDFSREARPDIATSSAPGFEVEAKYRIDEITVSIDGTWVRKYELEYGTGDNGVRSLLEAVTESGQAFDTGSSVVAELPATSFDYQTSLPGWATTTDFALPLPLRDSYSDTAVRIVDYNGDALPDIIRAKAGTTTLMYANDGDGWNLDTSWYFPLQFSDADGMDLGVRFADLNGDGFVDLMRSDGANVVSYLNTGSGFATSTVWETPFAFADSYGRDMGTRMGDINGDGLPDMLYSIWHPQFGYGSEAISLNTGNGWTGSALDVPVTTLNIWLISENVHKQSLGLELEDVNNDGLADFVARDSNQYIDGAVLINTGAGWAIEDTWDVPVGMGSDGNDSGQRLVDVNGDKLVDFIDGNTNNDIYLNTGTNWVLDTDWSLPFIIATQNGYASQLVDIDGDGMVDIVQRNTSVHNRYLNRGNPVDVITRVDESAGSSKSLVYGSSANAVTNPDLPFPMQTLASVGVSDGLGTIGTTTFAYEGGLFHLNGVLERSYAGFAMVAQTDSVGNVTKTYYHQGNASATSTGEYDDQYAKIGQIYRTEVYDDDDNLFSLQVNTWDQFNRGSRADFVFLATSTVLAYDGDNDHKDSAESFSYSTTTGSLIQKIDWGEVNGSTNGTFTDTGSDKYTTAYTYAASSTTNLLLPSSEVVTNQSSVKVRETKNYYDTLSFGSVSKGNLTKQEAWKGSSDYIDTEKTYNTYGLVTEEKDPRDKVTTIAYDTYNLYPATTTNPLSHTTGRLYDYSSGKVNRVIDSNSRVFTTLFDPFDRVIEEKQPDLSTPSTLVTRATYSYTDTSMPRRVQKTDYLSSATSTVSYSYANGLGKTVEERTEAEGTNTYVVRDFTYDTRGLLATESLPFFASSTAYTATSSPAESDLIAEYTYDALQRVISLENVMGTTETEYDQWKTIVTDALDNAKEFEKDAFGNLVEVVEHNDGSSYTTEYEYDGNAKLTKITDAMGNVRNFAYDGLGRRTSAQDLHDSGDGTYGTWTYDYDASGNLTSQVDPKSQTIAFTYDDINRPLTENYTGAGGTEVQYVYDTCTNGVGRLCVATSTDAVTTYAYTPVGSIASETKRIDSVNYTTQYSYDRKGNTTLITYPDSSEVAYRYNDAGLLESVAQRESGGSFASIVDTLDYAPTGKVAYKLFGNGVSSIYTYDAAHLYRLTNILTRKGEEEESLMGGGGELGFLGGAFEPFMLASATYLSQLELEEGTALDIAEDIAPVPEVSVEPVVEEETGTSTPSEVIEEPIEIPATTAPADAVPEVATTSPEVSLPAPEIATTTEEVLIPETKEFLLDALPGMPVQEGANIKTTQIGVDEKGDPKYTAEVYQSAVQYVDSLAGEKRDIDLGLIDVSDAWVMTKAGYGARIAKESGDHALTFRYGDLEVYLGTSGEEKAVQANRETPNGREVIQYPNALGDGIDMEAYLSPDALWKMAVIENLDATKQLAQTDGYIEIPFSLQANQEIDLISDTGESLSQNDSFETGGVVTIVTKSGTTAYLRPPQAYADDGSAIAITIRYEKTENGVRLIKRVPTEWLEQAAFPVRTDSVVTYYYSTDGSGSVDKSGNSSTTWTSIRAASSGNANGNLYVNSQYDNGSGSTYISRAVLNFDTSYLPDTASTTDAQINIYVTSRNNLDNDGNDFIRVVQNTIASTTSLVGDDYDQVGTTTNPTAGATDVDISSLNVNSYNGLYFNSTGMSWINTTGYTKLGLREGHDVVNDRPSNANGIAIKEYQSWSPNNTPKLIITYVLPNTPSEPTALQVEEATNPTEIMDYTPDFSAEYEDADAEDMAYSYQIQVATSTAFASTLWDSGKTNLLTPVAVNGRTEQISYTGSSLDPETTYYWRIKLWDGADMASGWSTTTASFSISDTAPIIPIYKNVSTTDWTGSYAISIAKPTGLQEGDLMIALIASDGSMSSTPEGWTFINGEVSSINRLGLAAWAKTATAADVATTSYEFNGGSYAIAGSIVRVENASLANIQSSLVSDSAWFYGGTEYFSPGVTPAQENSLLLTSFHASYRNSTFSDYAIEVDNPTSWTEVVDSGTTLDADHMWSIATANRSTATTTGQFIVTTPAHGGVRAYGLLLAIAGNAPPSAPTELHTEGTEDPVIVTDDTPEFSAVYEDLDVGDVGVYYQLQVATSSSFTSPYWDSGQVTMASTSINARSAEIAYAGTALVRDTTYHWRIRFWDNDGVAGDWSADDSFFFGLSATSDVIQDISYLYDAVGNITRITDVSGTEAAKIVNYGYDDLYRLTSAATSVASSSPFNHTYVYNAIGNITSSTPSGVYAYAETGYVNPHAPTTVGGVSLGYDNNGNRTSYGSTTYAFDYRNRMAGFNSGMGTTTYGYDHTSNRVFKDIGATTTVYANDLYDTDGTTKTKHIFAGGELLATVETAGATSTTQYLHADHLGSTNDVTDAEGDVVQTSDYLPYGDERVSVESGDFSESRTYIGELHDEESDLSYLNARYYDGARGQFTSQDPVFWEINQTEDGKRVLMDPQLQNSYSYARNNPIVNKDPDGRIIPLILAAYGVATLAIDSYDLVLTNTNISIPGTNYRVGYSDQFSDMDKQISQNQFAYDLISGTAGRGLSAAGKITLSSLEAALDTLEKLTGKAYSEAIFRRDANKNGNVKVQGTSGQGTGQSNSRSSVQNGSQSNRSGYSNISPATLRDLQNRVNNIKKELNKLQKQQSSKKR